MRILIAAVIVLASATASLCQGYTPSYPSPRAYMTYNGDATVSMSSSQAPSAYAEAERTQAGKQHKTNQNKLKDRAPTSGN